MAPWPTASKKSPPPSTDGNRCGCYRKRRESEQQGESGGVDNGAGDGGMWPCEKSVRSQSLHPEGAVERALRGGVGQCDQVRWSDGDGELRIGGGGRREDGAREIWRVGKSLKSSRRDAGGGARATSGNARFFDSGGHRYGPSSLRMTVGGAVARCRTQATKQARTRR